MQPVEHAGGIYRQHDARSVSMSASPALAAEERIT